MVRIAVAIAEQLSWLKAFATSKIPTAIGVGPEGMWASGFASLGSALAVVAEQYESLVQRWL